MKNVKLSETDLKQRNRLNRRILNLKLWKPSIYQNHDLLHENDEHVVTNSKQIYMFKYGYLITKVYEKNLFRSKGLYTSRSENPIRLNQIRRVKVE